MNKSMGFTLIEIMIAVVVVAILTVVALPIYNGFVLQSHRSVAINAILDLASREARYFTTNNAYTNDMTKLGYAASPQPVPNSSDHYYDLSVSSPATATTSFSLKAVPAGNQANDSCGNYTYSDLGIKGISSGTVHDCWKQ